VLDLFRDAAATSLSAIGEDSLLRGSEPCNVHIAHGVQIEGPDDTAVYTRSVASIESVMSPKVGDRLTHPEGNFILDVKLRDSGAMVRFVIRSVTDSD
jgi:hypothetical protein